jgi:hypothetical protein
MARKKHPRCACCRRVWYRPVATCPDCYKLRAQLSKCRATADRRGKGPGRPQLEERIRLYSRRAQEAMPLFQGVDTRRLTRYDLT